MIKNKENSEHYFWANVCSGWHLVKSDNLSVIQEIMPANTSEQKHYHNKSQQFFYILNGIATFEIEGKQMVVKQGSGIHILPKLEHRIYNYEKYELEFLVISQPATKNDRINT